MTQPSAASPRPRTAWSFGATINGFDELRDDESRPVQENRAPAAMKEGVPMRMRRCPYADERHGKMMNVSALAQITRHLDAVLEDIARFVAALPPAPPTWDRFCAALMDQLARPALAVLRGPTTAVTIPASMAVGYKVAAGYLVPTRELMSLSLGPGAPAATVHNLIDYVHRRESLVGAREVCAAPMNMVEQVSRTLLLGGSTASGSASDERILMARELTRQQWLGLTWRTFDLEFERRLLLEDFGEQALRPRTPHVAGLLSKRLDAIRDAEATPEVVPPPELGTTCGDRLRRALEWADASNAWPETSDLVEQLVAHGDGAIRLVDVERAPLLARRFAAYALVLEEFEREFDGIERGLRSSLGFDPDAPILRHPAFLPEPKALRWLEMIAGHRRRPDPEAPSRLVLRNQHRTVGLPPSPVAPLAARQPPGARQPPLPAAT